MATPDNTDELFREARDSVLVRLEEALGMPELQSERVTVTQVLGVGQPLAAEIGRTMVDWNVQHGDVAELADKMEERRIGGRARVFLAAGLCCESDAVDRPERREDALRQALEFYRQAALDGDSTVRKMWLTRGG